MTNDRISELSAATALTGSEIVPAVQVGETVKATVSQILAAPGNTAAVGDNTTKLATTAFVNANCFFTIQTGYYNVASPADASTYYIGPDNMDQTTTVDLKIGVIPFNCTLVGFIISSYSSGSCTQEASSVYFRYNATDVLLSNAVIFSNTAVLLTNIYSMGLSTSLSAGDTWQIKIVNPSWVTNPTNQRMSILLFFKIR
jgi:hypothetical protein